MDKEILVDENLLHLQNVILDLDSYKYDKDIIKLLNELKTLIDLKLYSSIGFDDYDITDIKYKMIIHLEK